jgi:DNA-binding SARP family transcriptional activator/tetratricopeptide (TPR) repeat protein/energy-coupling factor transporter ATP-binding protein EcfA2
MFLVGKRKQGMSLKIFLLGQFKLLAQDRQIELPSRSAQSLLAYLALNAGVNQRREKLSSLLWPDANESNSRSYLRQALWRIRKALESGDLNWEDYLQISNIDVAFDALSDYWLDAELIVDASETLSDDDLINQVDLYRGELLPGFYDEWIVLERDRLLSAYHRKNSLLVERLIRVGRFDDVLKWSEQWIHLGYSPEPAFRALMIAHASTGNMGLVDAAFQRCEDSLRRELGLRPSAETKELYQRIKSGEFKTAGSNSHFSAAQEIKQPAFLNGAERLEDEKPNFVARQNELSRLDTFFRMVLAGQGRVVFVTGEAGSGKTALIQEFIRLAQAAYPEVIVANGDCSAYTGIGDPYLPFREILELLSGDVESRWAAGAMSSERAKRLWSLIPFTAQALVEIGPDLIDTFVPGIAFRDRMTAAVSDKEIWIGRLDQVIERRHNLPGIPSPQQSDLFEQFTKVLQTLSRKVVLVLVLDDLQWADLGSISLLFHLGRRLSRSRILVIGAYRPEEIAIGRNGDRHPLDTVVNELRREFGDIFVNLSLVEDQDFVNGILDSEPNRLGIPFRELLFRQTHGHPLFTIELLRGMQERGDLVRDLNGNWIEGPALDWDSLPARVDAVIAERIDRLAPELRDVLQIACIEGEVFTAEVIAGVAQVEGKQVLERLSGELDRKHRLIRPESIVRMDGQLLSRYRFRHILVQKYLYSSMDELERVHLHELVGREIEGLYSTLELGQVAVQLAMQFQKAGIKEKAIKYFHLSGERAVRLSAYQESIAHLESGLTLLNSLPASSKRDQQELDLQISLGIARKIDIPDPEGEKAWNRAWQLCQKYGNTIQLYQVMSELSIFPYVRGEYSKAYEKAEEALKLAQKVQDPVLEAISNWHMGYILFGMGEFERSHAYLQQVISFYEPQKHHQAFVSVRGSDAGVSALAYDACCLWCLGYADQALERSRTSITLAHELNHIFSLVDVLCFAGCLFHSLRREIQSVYEYATELGDLSERKGFLSFGGTAINYLGEALTLKGQLSQGIEHLHRGTAQRFSIGARCYQTGFEGALSKALFDSNLPYEAMQVLDEALALVENMNERYYQSQLLLLKAEFISKQGDLVRAESIFLEAMDVARQQHASMWQLRVANSLAGFYFQQGRSDEARQVVSEIYYWFTEGFDTPDMLQASSLLQKMA